MESKLTVEEIKALFYIRSLSKAYIQDNCGFQDICSNNNDVIIHEYSDELLDILSKQGLVEYR